MGIAPSALTGGGRARSTPWRYLGSMAVKWLQLWMNAVSLSVSPAGQKRLKISLLNLVPSPKDIRNQMGILARAHPSASRFSNDNISRSWLRRNNKPARAKTSSKFNNVCFHNICSQQKIESYLVIINKKGSHKEPEFLFPMIKCKKKAIKLQVMMPFLH
jgi:hypothetical protein